MELYARLFYKKVSGDISAVGFDLEFWMFNFGFKNVG